jgi:hypothetical protein
MINCKLCEHADILFYVSKGKESNVAENKTSGKVFCNSPKYKGKKYIRNDKCENCDYFKMIKGN